MSENILGSDVWCTTCKRPHPIGLHFQKAEPHMSTGMIENALNITTKIQNTIQRLKTHLSPNHPLATETAELLQWLLDHTNLDNLPKEPTEPCGRCRGTGRIHHSCTQTDRFDRLETQYERMSMSGSEGLYIMKCKICNKLWKLRSQYDHGTGCDDIWLKEGQNDRGYTFTTEEANKYR